jgi:hypothetical protein
MSCSLQKRFSKPLKGARIRIQQGQVVYSLSILKFSFRATDPGHNYIINA